MRTFTETNLGIAYVNDKTEARYLVVQVLDEVHEVVVDGLVVRVDDPVQVREVAVQVDVVGVGTTGEEVLATLHEKERAI